MGNEAYKLKIRQTDKQIFLLIKNGAKKIETRAAIADYKKIEKGDTIIFICGKNKVKKKVVEVKLYKNISSLFRYYKVQEIFPTLKTVEQARRVYYSFPNYREKLKKFGLIVFKLK